jgi:predicted O-methyltransferase YrrM
MQSQIHTVARHYRNLAMLTANMLLPTRTALELGARCKRTYDDIHFSVPSLHLREMFPRIATDPDNAVKLMPGTALDGGPNLIEQFTLCALVKKIQPRTILEIGTFRGGTTWHFYDNAPPDTIIYTLDLPDDEVPGDVTDQQLAANKSRPFLPKSERVRQILINSKKWDGVLDRKVQFAFIDADHSYQGVRNDTEKALVSLDSCACICWHDSLEDNFGYGTMRYSRELVGEGWKIFRLRGSHEISSLTIFMTDEMREKFNVPEPRGGAYLFRDYVGR